MFITPVPTVEKGLSFLLFVRLLDGHSKIRRENLVDGHFQNWDNLSLKCFSVCSDFSVGNFLGT